jgi:P4 family phage/plasmid primase-like protien
MMNVPRPDVAVNFVSDVFRFTSGPVLLAKLPGHSEITTRKPGEIKHFIERHDKPGNGLYFCVSTIREEATIPDGKSSLRCKENAAEIPALFADTDSKDIEGDLPTAVERIRTLPLPPSKIVWSGHGLHCYWVLTEPLDCQKDRDRIEGLLRQLADLVGGDLACTEVARLMRLPGSHNTKDGDWLEVAVEGEGRRYDVSEIEDMLAMCSPVVRRKEAEALRPGASGQCPFEAVARRMGYKPPVDVEARLKSMRYQGAGDAAIHSTQLSVSASLMLAGRPEDEIVSTIIEATRAAAGEYGSRWNWSREEQAVRRMCADWRRKNPQIASLEGRERRERPAPDEPGEVHSMDGARAKRKAKEPPSDEKESAHIVLGEGVLAALEARGEALLFTPKAAWRYSSGIWTMMMAGAAEFLNVQIEEGCKALGLKSSNRLTSEARGWIMRQPRLWRETIPWDQHGKVPTRSGLVDPRTLEVEPAKPEHFCTWRVESNYDPKAECPWWETMIADVFAERTHVARGEIVSVIQEILGAGMIDIKPRGLSKGLILQGGSNVGKSGLIEVLSGMFGDDPITAALDGLEGTHGLMPFLRRAPWTLHEAFEQAKWHLSASVKAIITGEPINVNVKNGPILSARVRAPVFWGTNYPPQFKEATTAIVNRFIILECKRVFDEDDPAIGAAAEAERLGFDRPSSFVLATERPGILNWALTGLRRAQERGRLAKTEEIIQTREALHHAGNLVAGFVQECVEFDPHSMVSVPDFCAAFSVWWAENKGETRNTISNDSIGRAMAALAEPRIAINPKELRDMRRRYYGGIALNALGLEYQKRALEVSMFEAKTTAATEAGGAVNQEIPGSWDDKRSVVAMRKAHAGKGMTPLSDDSFMLHDAEVSQKPSVIDTSEGVECVIGSVIPPLSCQQVVDDEGEILF